jgi:hypothetical protein
MNQADKTPPAGDQQQPIVSPQPPKTTDETLTCSICKNPLPSTWQQGQPCPSCGNCGPGARGVHAKTEATLMPLVRQLTGIQEGSVIVIRTPITPPEVRPMFTQLQAHFAALGIRNVRFFVIPPDTDVEVWNDAEIEQAGLQRKS